MNVDINKYCVLLDAEFIKSTKCFEYAGFYCGCNKYPRRASYYC